jgi:hypothetical protein
MAQIGLTISVSLAETLKEYADTRGVTLNAAAELLLNSAMMIFLEGQKAGVDKAGKVFDNLGTNR